MTTPNKHVDQSRVAQRKRVLECLRHGPKTTYDFRRQGISNPSARIQELVVEGHVIESARVTTVDGDGYLHRGVARYEHLGGPSQFDPDASHLP